MEGQVVRLWRDAPLERPSRRRRGKSRGHGIQLSGKRTEDAHIIVL